MIDTPVLIVVGERVVEDKVVMVGGASKWWWAHK